MNIANIIDKHEPDGFIFPSDIEKMKAAKQYDGKIDLRYVYSISVSSSAEQSHPVYTRATVEKMLGEVKSAVFDLLTKARHQLPMAAQCWNEDDDRDRADRNIKHVLELIDDVDEFLSQNRPAAPSPAKEQG